MRSNGCFRMAGPRMKITNIAGDETSVTSRFGTPI